MQNLKAIGRFFRLTTLLTLSITILIMGGLWIYSSYTNFHRESKQLKEEYIASQKSLIQAEVNKAIGKIEYHKSKAEEKLRESIRERTYEAYRTAMNIYLKNKNSKSKEEIVHIIAETYSGVTYNRGRGYYFGGRVEDQVFLFTNRSEFEGKKMLDYQSPEGKYIFRDIIEIVESEGEGFYEYMWEHPNDNGNEHKKLSFVKLIEPLNLWIGTGEYYADFIHELQQDLLEEISMISFGKDGYIFVDDFNGLKLAVGDRAQSHLIGENLWELKNPNGVKVAQEYKKIAKKKVGGFINYKWYKSSKEAPVDKIAFIKGVPDWNWMVGTGVYLDDINDTIDAKMEDLKEEAVKNISGIIVIMLFLSTLVVLLERRVLKKVKGIIKYEESIYTTILNLSMNGIYLGNDRGEILDCNKIAHGMLGYTKEELLNLSLDDLIARNRKEDFLETIDKNMNNRCEELVLKKKDGTSFIAEIVKSPLEIGEEKRQITFIKDITERKNIEKRLKELSIRDELTQIYNRRYILKKLTSEIEKPNEGGRPLSISLIDIDHFKKINDTFGHMVGDEVLRSIAEMLQENLRSGDYVGRYGGEEFLIILPNTELEEALEAIQRVKTKINRLVWEAKELRTTFSGGIVEINSKKTHFKLKEVIVEVDKLLYRAKNNGRNRIEV